MAEFQEIEEIALVKKKYPYLFAKKSVFLHELGGSFIPLKISHCNGRYDYSFSEADMVVKACQATEPGTLQKIDFRHAVTESYIYMGVLSDLLSGNTAAVQNLGHFFSTHEHISCLKKMSQETENLSESTLQTVLAVHLFGPLKSHSNVRVDGKRYKGQDGTKCKYCGAKVRIDDTSFGNIQAWHGYGDILLDHNVVKVEKELEEVDPDKVRDQYNADVDYSVPHDFDEPAAKKMKIETPGTAGGDAGGSDDKGPLNTTEVELSTDSYMPEGPTQITWSDLPVKKSNKTLSQVLSQTIVNAFLQVKLNPDLKGWFIPSFLASNKHVTIHMYNPAHDYLLTQEKAMPIWNAEELDDLTILSIWMALNMHNFSRPADHFELFEKSEFHSLLGPEKLSLYEEDLEMPLPNLPSQQLFYRSDTRKSFQIVEEELNKVLSSQ